MPTSPFHFDESNCCQRRRRVGHGFVVVDESPCHGYARRHVAFVAGHGAWPRLFQLTVGSHAFISEPLLVQRGKRCGAVDPQKSPFRVVLFGFDLGEKRTGAVVVELHFDPGRLLEGRGFSRIVALGRIMTRGGPAAAVVERARSELVAATAVPVLMTTVNAALARATPADPGGPGCGLGSWHDFLA